MNEKRIKRAAMNMQNMFEREHGLEPTKNTYSNFDKYFAEFKIDHNFSDAECMAFEKCEREAK